jgi:hypothetical protein
VRPRTLLLFALVALLGAAAAVPALAGASVVNLEVKQNCVEAEWPCWTTELSASRPQPALTVKIAVGDEVMFTDHDASTAAAVVWMGSAPACTNVPTSAMNNWEGKCTFATPGTYKFESSTLFSLGPNYTKYEVVVAGPPTPTATTEQATAVTETEATLNGDVNPEGQATSYYFEYGTTTGYGSKTTETSASGVGRVSAALTGLSPNTTYDFQLVAVYGAGKTKVEGGNTTFKTAAPPSAPTASTQSATGVSETEATLQGTIDPDGEATEYFFEYGTDTNYGQKTAKATLQTSGGSNQGVSAILKGLTPGTEYHFRLVAKNNHGPGEGLDRSFKTMSTPVKEPTPTPTPAPTPTPGPISPAPEIIPLVSPLVEGSLKLTAPRHGSVVGGSVEVSKSGAGGRLEVDMIANSASLATVRHKKSTSTVVGRLVRTSLSAGKVSFSISLNAKAKSALRRHHKLALTVKITVMPVQGAAETVTRAVVLHA